MLFQPPRIVIIITAAHTHRLGDNHDSSFKLSRTYIQSISLCGGHCASFTPRNYFSLFKYPWAGRQASSKKSFENIFDFFSYEIEIFIRTHAQDARTHTSHFLYLIFLTVNATHTYTNHINVQKRSLGNISYMQTVHDFSISSKLMFNTCCVILTL